MSNSKLKIIALVSAILLLITGCNGLMISREVTTDQGGGDKRLLRVAWSREELTLDPHRAESKTDLQIINSIGEGLLRMKEDGRVEKGSGLAENWEVSEDGLVYVFYLREALWSDGTPITAEHFRQSWLEALDPEMGSPYVEYLYVIKNAKKYYDGEIKDKGKVMVEAIDDHILQVTLEKPLSIFPSLTALPVFFPMPSHLEKDRLAFSGPFILEEPVKLENLTLKKNENYWDREKVAIDEIEGLFVEEEEKIRAFKEERVDFTSFYLREGQDEEALRSAVETIEGAVWWVQFNGQNPLFKNKKIRKAFSYAIDRRDLVESTIKFGSRASFGLIPPGFPTAQGRPYKEEDHRFFEDIGSENVDEQYIKTLYGEGLKEVKMRKGMSNPVQFLVRDTETALKIAHRLKEMWEAHLGVKIEIEAVPLKEQLDRMERGEYELAYTGWFSDYNDPMGLLEIWKKENPYNTSFWSHSVYKEQIDFLNTSIDDQRLEGILKAEKILMDEMILCPLYYKTQGYLIREGIEGIIKFPGGIFNEFKYVNME